VGDAHLAPPVGDAPTARGGAWVAGQIAIGAAAVVLGVVGPRWPAAVRVPFVVVGSILVAVGLAMLVAGGAFLGSALTPYPRPRADASLREDGIYRIVRHPMYGGTILVAAGWGIASSPIALAAGLTLGAFLELKSRREERWLLERYATYEAYRRRTRWKFVPGVR
jgi:protein-S-isoprenylcysteine O-methyltransferase Ste14